MRADTVSTSNIKNRIGNKLPTEKFADVRHLLDEKRQHTRPHHLGSSAKSGIVLSCLWASLLSSREHIGAGMGPWIEWCLLWTALVVLVHHV